MTRSAATTGTGSRTIALWTTRRHMLWRWLHHSSGGPVVLLVSMHLIVAFQVRPAPRWNDAIFELMAARDYPDVPLTQHALRIGNVFPARVLVDVFGYGQVAYYAWPFLMGVLLVVATYALGTVLFSRGVGFAAAVLMVFQPVLVQTRIRFGSERMASWHLLPDVPSAALFTLGVVLLVRGCQAGREQPGGSGWFLAAGACFGWAYLVRELSVFLFPTVAAALALWHQPPRRYAQVAGPMATLLLVELASAQLVYGDALARLRVGAEHGSPPRGELSRLDALLRLPRIVAAYPQTVMVLATIALLILGAVLWRTREQRLLLIWFASLWIPLTLFSGLLSPDYIKINASLMRYWIPVLPAVCVGASGAVAAALTWLQRRPPMVRTPWAHFMAPAVGVTLLTAWVLPQMRDILTNPQDASWNRVRVALTSADDEVREVVTDDRDALTLGIYQRRPVGGALAWTARLVTVPHDRPTAPPAPAGPAADGVWLLWTPQMSPRPDGASGWRLVLKQPQLRLYQAAGD